MIRFSSIGDIVLTTPVIRCLKKQLPGAEIHYFTKTAYRSILEPNPYVDRIHSFSEHISECIPALKSERFDYVIDLHRNIRTLRVKRALSVKSYTFPKLNFQKWLLVYLKRNRMPDVHVTTRYFEAVKALGITPDKKNGDYFLPEATSVDLKELNLHPQQFVAFAIGAQFATKRLPIEKINEILRKTELPIVLLGGKEDAERSAEIVLSNPDRMITDLCGKLSLAESAWMVKNSALLVTHDTGLMHIAACFGKRIISVWGNTVPALGMYPYMPEKANFSIHEVAGLPCRPCSKIGYAKCPQKHFKCMLEQDTSAIAADISESFEKIR